DTVTVKVIVNELPPVITLTATGDSVCPGAPVTVRVASAGSESTSQYTWKVNGSDVGSGLQKSPNISVATKFEVQRTDVNGCITTADTTIQVYVPEVLNLSEDQTVCSMPTPNLTLTASGLTGSGVYTWSSVPNDPNLGTNGTSHTVSPTQNTTYYVDGMDGHGCTVKRDSIVIKVDQMPIFNLSAHRLAACNSVKLYDAVGAVSPDGATLKYGTTANFTGGTTFTSTSTVSESRLYYVRAENGVCKSDEDTVRVNILTAPQLKLLASTIETCEPDSVDLATNVDWTPGTGTTFDAMNLTYWDGTPATGTQLTSTMVYPGVTSKTYSVQGASDGCPSKVETVTVVVHPKPVLEISVSDTAVCTATADLNVAVNAQGGLSVTKTYFTDATYATPLASSLVSSGTYYVIGETAVGCKDSIEVTVRVKPHPVVTLTASADMVCKDATVDLTVNGGAPTDTYSWKVNGTSVTESSNHFTSPAIATNTPIEVTVTNTEGCETVLDTTIGVYISTVTLAASSNCLGETVTITATLTGDGTPTGYVWTGATPIGVTNQATLTLTASDQTVGVEVTTDKGCTIEGQQEFRGRPCGVLVVEAPDTTICLSADDVILTAHSFGGTVTDWTWTQVAGSTVALTFADSVLTLPSTTPLGTYQFEVSVNGGAAKDTAEVTIQQGVTITSLLALDSCSSVVNFQVVAVNATSYDWDLLSANGMGYNVPGNINKWELTLDGGETNYSVAVTAYNDSGCEAHDTLSGHILNTGLMLAFGGNDTCGTNIQLPVRYSVNGGYGDVVMKYTYQSQNGTQTEDSIRVNPPSSVSLTAANPGIYVLTKVYATNAPGCLVTVNDTVKIGALPEVELDENCLALHKDSTFNLNIVNSGDFDYIWGVQESSDGVVWTGGTGDGATTTSVNGMMGDKDLQYIITATDRNLPQCKASDTAHIYRIPDAPIVDIDTVGDRYHAQVVWTASDVADGYTVWSRKWDPYCMTTAYTGDTVYHAEPTGTNIADTFWVEPSMDSLKFFYVTADINVCGSWYNSLSSVDTVGYKLDLLEKSTVSGTHNNHITWMFDMTSKGILTSVDVLERLSSELVIRSWDLNEQGWTIQTYKNPLFDYFGGDKYVGAFNLEVGSVYQIDAAVYVGQVLQYGKLGEYLHQSLKPSTIRGTHNNMNTLPFHKTYLLKTDEILEEITTSVITAIRKWDMQQQGWTIQTYKNPLFDYFGGDKYIGVEFIHPGEVMQFDFINTYGSYTWE
nr:hypothetical protein [Odoribacter sp.]